MKVIEYSSNRAKETTEIFYQSIHAIDNTIYSESQKQAWAPLPIEYEKWAKRLELKKPYLLLINDKIAGFIELESDGYINCFYVSPDFQRIGVASTLLNYLIDSAKSLGINLLTVEASLVVKPLFEKFGFITEKMNKIRRKNTVLINYSMRKKI